MSHAILSPSSAERWMTCPGSVYFDVRLPDVAGEYAEEGTQAHALAEAMLSEGRVEDPYDNYSDEMLDEVRPYVNYARQASQGAVLFDIEQRLDLSHIVPESFGTADAVIITPLAENPDQYELHVIDLKFGRGVEVSAVQNKQGMLYALGVLENASLIYDFQRIRITIHQPRINNVSEWDLSVAELLQAGEAFSKAGEYAIQFKDKEPEYTDFNPTKEACKFCKAKAHCKALADRVQEEMSQDFDDLTKQNEETIAGPLLAIDNERLGQIMSVIELIEIFTKAVRARVEAELLRGTPVPGFKLVEGRLGHRRWIDDVQAEAALKSARLKADEMYNKKIITPTQADKLLKELPRKWAKVKDLITADEGKPSVAPESDKRPALVIDHTADFIDLTQTQTV